MDNTLSSVSLRYGKSDAAEQALRAHGFERGQALAGRRHVRLDLFAQRVVISGDGHFYQHRRQRGDPLQNVRVALHQRAFGSDGHAETVSFQKQQRAAGEPQPRFQRIVGVAHGTCAHQAFFALAAQIAFHQRQRVFLDTYGVELLDLVTVAAAVAIDTAVAASAVQVHIIVRAEPRLVLRARYDGLGRYGTDFRCVRAVHFVPVEPNPPAPRAVSVSASHTLNAARYTGAITSCAMRSPGSTRASAPLWLCSATITSPR